MKQQPGRSLSTISSEIEMLREVLNEIVADKENSQESVLAVSMELDKLINEYMLYNYRNLEVDDSKTKK